MYLSLTTSGRISCWATKLKPVSCFWGSHEAFRGWNVQVYKTKNKIKHGWLQNFTQNLQLLHSAPSKLLDNNSIWTMPCRKHVKQKHLLERVVRHMHPLCSCLREQRPLVLNSTWLEKIQNAPQTQQRAHNHNTAEQEIIFRQVLKRLQYMELLLPRDLCVNK